MRKQKRPHDAAFSAFKRQIQLFETSSLFSQGSVKYH